MDQENVPKPVSAIISFNDDNEVEPLTGKPFFNVIICKSHLQLNQLAIPTKFIEWLPKNVTAPVKLTRGNRSWDMNYSGYNYSLRRINTGWKKFAEDNMLKIGDVCLFELMSSDATLVKFKVQILRGDLPSAFLNTEGGTQNSPAVIEIE